MLIFLKTGRHALRSFTEDDVAGLYGLTPWRSAIPGAEQGEVEYAPAREEWLVMNPG
jgi:hypothetical protein